MSKVYFKKDRLKYGFLWIVTFSFTSSLSICLSTLLNICSSKLRLNSKDDLVKKLS